MPRKPRGRKTVKLWGGVLATSVAERHYDALRTGKRGLVTHVHHIRFGWITAKDYYDLQHEHAFVDRLIEGGYKAKAALWTSHLNVEVLDTGVTLPMGVAFVTGAIALALADKNAGNVPFAAMDILSLILPFGELWLVYRGIIALPDIAAATSVFSGSIANQSFQDVWKQFGPKG